MNNQATVSATLIQGLLNYASDIGLNLNDLQTSLGLRKTSLEYPEKRIQIHTPASGRNKLNKATTLLNEFIERAFTREGSYNMGPQLKNPSSWNCRFCPFNDQPELCNKNLS